MTKFCIVLKPGDRTVIAGSAAGGGNSGYVNGRFEKHTDGVVKVTIQADHVAYEGGFVTLYDDSPYDPIFVTSRDTLHAIYRLAEDAQVSN